MNNVNTAMWLFLLGLTQFGYSPWILTISVKGLVPCLSSWGWHDLSISLHKLEVQREIRNPEMGSRNPSGLCAYSTCESEGQISFNTNLHFPMQLIRSEQVYRWPTPYNRQFDWQTSHNYAARTCFIYNAR